MASRPQKTLNDYLSQQYPFVVTADEEGGYVIEFPDLPGCVTQVDDIAEVSPMAEEIRSLWIETAYDMGIEIPPPTYPATYSGKFNVRLPRSLHRRLAEAAEEEGVSLNQYVVALLSAGVSTSGEIQRKLDRIESALNAMDPGVLRHLATDVSSTPEGAHP